MDDEIREILEARARRAGAPDPSSIARAAIDAPSRTPGLLAPLRRVSGLTLAVACLIVVAAAAVVTGLNLRPNLDRAASSPTLLATPSPSESGRALISVPRAPDAPPIRLKFIDQPAAAWGSPPRYALCGTDVQGRAVVATTSAPSADGWTVHTVLPLRTRPDDPARCVFGIAGSSLVAFTGHVEAEAPEVPIRRAWLVTDAGARELPWDGPMPGSDTVRSTGETLLAIIESKEVFEIDATGAIRQWDVPNARIGVDVNGGVAVDPGGRRWLVGTPNAGDVSTDLWLDDGSGWRMTDFLPEGAVRDMWFEADGRVAFSTSARSTGISVTRAPSAGGPFETVRPLRNTPLIGVLPSGRMVTHEGTWLRVEPEDGTRWGWLPADLDRTGDDTWMRTLTVSGNDVVVTDALGVQLTPIGGAFFALTDERDDEPVRRAPDIELRFRDDTGIVVSATPFDAYGTGGGSRAATVFNKEGLARTLWVRWGAAGCQEKPAVRFAREGSTYVVTVNTGPYPETCDSVPGSFGVELQLTTAVDAEQVRTIFQDPPR